MTNIAQVVEAVEPTGRKVSFVVRPAGSEVTLLQQVDGEATGYRGRFTPQEAAELGAALLRASGVVAYQIAGDA